MITRESDTYRHVRAISGPEWSFIGITGGGIAFSVSLIRPVYGQDQSIGEIKAYNYSDNEGHSNARSIDRVLIGPGHNVKWHGKEDRSRQRPDIDSNPDHQYYIAYSYI